MTCQEALRKLFAEPKTFLTRGAVYEALDKTYPDKPWARGTIYLHLSFYSINNPRRKHHPATEGKCFLFWDGHDGFRRWIPEQDGTWVLGKDGIVYVGEDGAAEQVMAAGAPDSEDLDKNGDLVVIELKAGRAGDSVCGQILGYIAWVRKELAEGKKVRGIIVASDFSDRLRYAADEAGPIKLIRYNVTFNFSPVTH